MLAFVLVLTDQLVEHIWLANLPPWTHFASQVLFYGVSGSVLAWWALTALRRRVDETEAAQIALQQTHSTLAETSQRLEFLIRINHRLAEAEDEEALIDVILSLPLEVVPAVGCSLIRFDEHRRPLPAIHRGSLNPAVLDAWAAHLSESGNRATCEHCLASRVTDSVPCPLVTSVPNPPPVSHVHCLTLERGDREYGLLNVYMQDASYPDDREQELLEAMANEMALALESQRLRSHELDTLYQLQKTRRLSDLQRELSHMLTHTVRALEASGGALYLVNAETAKLDRLAQAGRSLGSASTLVEGLVSGAQGAEAPLIIGKLKQEGGVGENLRSLLVAPLRGRVQPLGSLALWAAQPNAFTRRHVRLITTLAEQVSLLVENHRLYLRAEHQVILSERARLAREIHDGLAQTLGYLKLRAAQVAGWLRGGNIQRVDDGLKEIQDLLAAAYVDTREAISGLHLTPGDGPVGEWLDQAALEFRSLSDIQIEVTTPPELSLPPEVGTQLVRIVQEALSNIRKHSHATQARLDLQANAYGLTLRIADDGLGFEAADVPPISQHGLRSMRERAELLDADFQIISRPGEGTQLVIRLPVEGLRPEGLDA
jgi:signal transduction histidine kinase